MKRTKPSRTILTNDPSITAWGWAVLDLQGNVLASGCIKTESQAKKLRIRKGDDFVRRVGEIDEQLLSIIRRWNVCYLLSELPHGSQNANAAKMIGAVAAIVQTLSIVLEMGVEWYSENDAKKVLFHKKSVSKREMIDKIKTIYKTDWFISVKYQDEAVADALAIHHVATKQSSVLKMLK